MSLLAKKPQQPIKIKNILKIFFIQTLRKWLIFRQYTSCCQFFQTFGKTVRCTYAAINAFE